MGVYEVFFFSVQLLAKMAEIVSISNLGRKRVPNLGCIDGKTAITKISFVRHTSIQLFPVICPQFLSIVLVRPLES